MDPSQNLQQIQISPSLEDVIRVGVVFLHSLSIGEESRGLRQQMEVIADELRRSIGERRPSTLEPVARTRRLYKVVGIDPTKTRPSSEKLLRRVLHGHPLPTINTFVDAMNLVSLRLQFPMGFYDWDQIVPPVLMRIGHPDEVYRAIGGGEERLQGKIVLVDGEGAFGNPTRDSQRTQISRRTVRALVLAFAPADTPRAAMEEVVQEVAAAARDHCGARVAARGLLPP